MPLIKHWIRLKISANVDSDIISCGGGGFRSAVWTQIRSNVLNTPLQTLAFGEPGILGAVTLAAIGTGIYSNFDAASTGLAQYGSPYLPDAQEADNYSSVFEIYKDAITANAHLGKLLTQAAEASKNG